MTHLNKNIQSKMTVLKRSEPVPFGMGIDRHARLFKYDDKVIRAIQPEFSDFYKKILDDKVVKKLIDDNILIQTKISPLRLDGYGLVLEHPLLPFISYPFEWTPSMLKDAARNILKLNLALLKNGLTTQDAHPWNVMFDGTMPKFVDFTSIIKTSPNARWDAVGEFNAYCLNSLRLMSKGYSTTVRSALHEIFRYPDPDLVRDLCKDNQTIYSYVQDVLGKIVKYLSCSAQHDTMLEGIKQIERMIEEVESINVKPRASEWSNYYSGENELPIYDGSIGGLNSIRTATPKHALIDSLLERIKPETVLDIGCNRGLYSQMAASRGAKVIGIDMDEQALDQMYHDSKSIGSYVLPLYLNAIAPMEAIGFKEIPFPSVTERLQSECVLCLALVHHFVFKKSQMDFKHIAKLLSSYSKKYLIVEFVPKEDKHVSKWYTDRHNWYTAENFKSELGRYFKGVKVHQSFPATRLIFFCEK